MKRAQEDGAVVPIYYESRFAKLGLQDLPTIDEQVEDLTEDEGEDGARKAKEPMGRA